jgi:type I restriction enzyme R subunit
MSKLPSEAGYQHDVLGWLEELGWEVYGFDDEYGGSRLDREYYRTDKREVIYWDLLTEWLVDSEINPEITDDNVDEVLNSLQRDLNHDTLVSGNRDFHDVLTTGKKFTLRAEGFVTDRDEDGDVDVIYVDLIDFENLENNRFIAADELQVDGPNGRIRPDVNLFVNGIPLVTMELKSIAEDNDFYDAIRDLKNYEKKRSRLFVPGLFNVAADQGEYRYAAVGAPQRFYMPWRNAPEQYAFEDNEPKQAIRAMCNHETLLNLLKNYVFHERQPGGDARIIPRYMQYYAVEKIFDLIRTTDHNRGLIWHTQGSGKSFTMLFAARNMIQGATLGDRDPVLDNPQVVVVVDTDDLESQMENQLNALNFDRFDVARSGAHLQRLLEEGRSTLILTTIQKFGNVDSDVQGNDETVVMSDEAHRYMEKDLGTKLNAALPDAYHFGFTGTPVREGDRDTFRNYEIPDSQDPYLHRYSIKDGIDDGLILPVHFDIHEIEWDIDRAGLNQAFDAEFDYLDLDEKRELIQEYVTQTEIAELRSRVSAVARSADEHYRGIEENDWKGMVVTPSRKAAALYGEELLKYRDPEEVEVLYTSNDPGAGDESGPGDKKLISQFHTTPEERSDIIRRFKDPDENPKLVVVCDMLLTGFDAPAVKAMYLDRNLKNHKLLQAIARTNRPAEQKNNGLIVDYQGVFRNLDEAFEYDDEEVKEMAAQPRDELFEKLERKIDDLLGLFEGIERDDSQETLLKCLSRVSSHPEKRDFKQGFREVRDLYETLEPDPDLEKTGIRDDYRWLLTIYIAFRRNNNRDESPEDEFRAQTQKILRENVNVTDIKREFPIYELNGEDLEAMLDLPSMGAKANAIEHATQAHLQPRVDSNPQYEEFGKRVERIITQRQKGSITDPEAVERLTEVSNEILEFEEELSEQGLSDASYAIYLTLDEEYGDVVSDEETAKDVAQDLWEGFEEEIQTDFEGWETRDSTRKTIRKMVIQRLIKNHGLSPLAKDDEFMEETIGYLIENAE